MPICNRCREKIGFFSSSNFNPQTGRCDRCDQEIMHALEVFKQTFISHLNSGILTEEKATQLRKLAADSGLDMNYGLYYVLPISIRLVNGTVDTLAKKGYITPSEEQHIRFLLKFLAIPREHVEAINSRIVTIHKHTEELRRRNALRDAYLKRAHDEAVKIRSGQLPSVTPSIYLESDEDCYMEMAAEYYRKLPLHLTDKMIQAISEVMRAGASNAGHGKLVATSKRLIYASQSKGIELDWKKILNAEIRNEAVFLEVSIQKGNGYYVVAEPIVAEAIIETLALKARGQTTSRSRRRPTPQAQPEATSPYEILGVETGAPEEEVNAAYRKLVLMYHPDKVASLAPEYKEIAERRMKEINAAYQALTK